MTHYSCYASAAEVKPENRDRRRCDARNPAGLADVRGANPAELLLRLETQLRHGGVIEFESQPGRTVFRMFLPMVVPMASREGQR